jgi:hypothetical protein
MSTWTETRETRHFAAEIKFLVDRSRGEAIRRWARGRLAPDPHGSGVHGDEYLTTSVYFDTAAFDVALRHGSFGRTKYRVRRYDRSDVVFLERKLRTSRFLTKRRSIIALDDLDLLDDRRPNPDWTGYWFQRRVTSRDLSPVCQVSYLRTARVGMTPAGPIRLTVDDHIAALPVTRLDFSDGDRTAVLDDQMVVEMKYRVSPPVVFKELAHEFGLAPEPVSKYRFAARRLALIPSSASPSTPASSEATL